jgi:hypothetical protein
MDIATNLGDDARDLQARQVGRIWRWRILALTLHHIRIIHASGVYPDEHIRRSGNRPWSFYRNQHIRRAGLMDFDSNHTMSLWLNE